MVIRYKINTDLLKGWLRISGKLASRLSGDLDLGTVQDEWRGISGE
jgi:hypothetical protein